MLDNIGVSLMMCVYIGIFSQSSERLVFCERNWIPRTETSLCAQPNAMWPLKPQVHMYRATPLQPLHASMLQHSVTNPQEPQIWTPSLQSKQGL